MAVSSLYKTIGTVYTLPTLPEGDKPLKYTTIGRFLFWLNKFFALKDEGKKVIQFYTGNHDYDTKPFEKGNIDYINRTPFLTFDNHFCVKPEHFIIPKLGVNTPNGSNNDNNVAFYFRHASDPILSEMLFNPEGNDILDILINLRFIDSVYEQVVTSTDRTSINIYDFVREILDYLNKDLGLINDFDLHLEDGTTYYIVDRKLSPSLRDLSLTKLDLVGLGSFVKNINLNSSLNQQLATYAVIGAAASKSDIPIEANAMEQWNENLKDRIVVNRNAAEQESSIDKDFTNKVIALYGYLAYLNRELEGLPKVSQGSLESSHKAVMSAFVEAETLRLKSNPSGILPIELSFQVKGLSGLKIGQAFSLEKGILPASYDNRVGFIITKISDTVENNEWSSDISTVMTVTAPSKEKKRYSARSLNDLINDGELLVAKEAFIEELERITVIQEAAKGTNDSDFFDELVKVSVEGRDNRSTLTPMWDGFRAAKPNEKRTFSFNRNAGTSQITTLKYTNAFASRKGIVNERLITLIRRTLEISQPTIKQFGGNPISVMEVYAGGQISEATLIDNSVDKNEWSRVRYGNGATNHDNGYSADVKFKDLRGNAFNPLSQSYFAKFIENFIRLGVGPEFNGVPRIGIGYLGKYGIHLQLYPRPERIKNPLTDGVNVFGKKQGDIKATFKGAPSWVQDIYIKVQKEVGNIYPYFPVRVK